MWTELVFNSSMYVKNMQNMEIGKNKKTATKVYYPLANEVAKGCSNATVRPSVTSLWTL
jgi:hypothetical protein